MMNDQELRIGQKEILDALSTLSSTQVEQGLTLARLETKLEAHGANDDERHTNLVKQLDAHSEEIGKLQITLAGIKGSAAGIALVVTLAMGGVWMLVRHAMTWKP